MNEKSNSFRGVLKQVLIAIPLLFLCSIPIFYAMAVYLEVPGIVYVSARGLRVAVAVIIGFAIRKKQQEMIDRDVLRRKKYMNFIGGLVCVSILLYLTGITRNLYWDISASVGIFSLTIHPFQVILWEQLFAGDLYWSILLCLATVFVRLPEARKAYE